jgi:ligand-binding sensor domain-containing protein
MKKIFRLLLITCCMASMSACKKPKNNPQPNHENEKPQWQLFATANSRLPDQQVNTIVIDKDDIKWVGTANGLLRIAGDTWTVYNDKNSGLPSSFILSIAAQDDGIIWIGTTKGLAKFNGTNWAVFTTANSILPDQQIMSLAHDKLNNRTWVGTPRGIVEISGQDQWTLHDETEDELPLAMVTDKNGALWIGAHDHVSFRGSIKKFQNGIWTSYQLDLMGYPSTFPYAIGVDKYNAVVATLTGTAVRSVIKFNGTGWNEIALPAKAFGPRALGLEGDKIWAGGTELMRLNDIHSAVIDMPANKPVILSIAIDSHGNKWLGTTTNGLMVYHE